jgi:cytochrome c-type biogenesis protein
MTELVVGLGTAFWLGILTSLSPCPLASNIAAVSYISKTMVHVGAVMRAGIAYTAGRMAAYALVGFIIVASVLSVPVIAQFLQQHISKLLGPILIAVGLVLLDVVKIGVPGLVLSDETQKRLGRTGNILGPFALGFVFALAFCPVSAALFFGSLIPLSLQNRFGTLLPFIYGLGTGVPVLIFALGIALGARWVSRWIQRVGRVEYWARKATAVIFIAAGAYYLWMYGFGGVRIF